MEVIYPSANYSSTKIFWPSISMLLIFQSYIRSIIGFSAPWKTDGLCPDVHQNRQFPKSMSRSVCTQCLVRNNITVAYTQYSLDKYGNHQREKMSNTFMMMCQQRNTIQNNKKK